jgi:cell division protein FtsQ
MSDKAEIILERRMEKRRRRRKVKGMFFLALLFSIGILIFALYSPIFIIQGLDVQGADRLKKEDIISASRIQNGLNIFKFSTIRARKDIEKVPYVKEVSVQRKLPNVVQISVKERTPLAAVMYLSSYILIDKEGIALEVNPDIKSKNLIEIKGIQLNNFTLGKPITENNAAGLGAALDILTLLQKDDLLSKIEYIDVKDSDKIMMYLDNRVNVNLGDKVILSAAGECKYRLDLLKNIIQSGQISKSGYIDLTRERATFRPNTEGEQQ